MTTHRLQKPVDELAKKHILVFVPRRQTNSRLCYIRISSKLSCFLACKIWCLRGALKAVMRIARYFIDNKQLCIFQPWGSDEVSWRMYSDSDQSSCAEPSNK